MRSRTSSGVRLDYLMRCVRKTILPKLDPVTALLGSNLVGFESHAWVRDNCYVVHCLWAMTLAFRKRVDAEDDKGKVYEMEQVCVKVMRSLMNCMMRQADKVERFKRTQAPKDALHAKYSAKDLSEVCGDHEWGHLQIDATSLFLLTLAQITASGLQIVFTLDEVSFIQNMVFYIETSYRIPDFGIWERGDKTNHGLVELNASSIGMAKAALQAMNDLDLFGAYGSPSSVIHVSADEVQNCDAVLRAMLPRESYSKEVDAALLSIISYPAFAVENAQKIDETKAKILTLLKGKYGCIRFLRDGYKSPREDSRRLYYEPWELQNFEHTECQWPLFLCYLILDALFRNDKAKAKEYRDELEQIMVKDAHGIKLVPELYAVPPENADAEIMQPGSQERVASGAMPYLWAQSLYFVTCLVEEGFLQPSELDPLNRRLSSENKPDTVVQVVILAEDDEVKKTLAAQNLKVQTLDDAHPFIIQRASMLGKIYCQLGKSEKIGLKGRLNEEVGLLTTSKLYLLDDRILVFTPEFMDFERFYVRSDLKILIDVMKSELFYLKTNWTLSGRPVVTVVVTKNFLIHPDDGTDPTLPQVLIGSLKKMKNGYFSGTRIACGSLHDFVSTSCMTRLHFLEAGSLYDEPVDVDRSVKRQLDAALKRSYSVSRRSQVAQLPTTVSISRNLSHLSGATTPADYVDNFARKISKNMSLNHRKKMSIVSGLTQRRRTMVMQGDDEDLRRLRLKFSGTLPAGSGGRSGATSPGTGVEFERFLSVGDESTTISSDSPLHSPFNRSDSGTPHGSRDTSPLLLRTRGNTVNDNEPTELLHHVASRHDHNAFDELDYKELVEMLLETESIEEQADIVHYLHLKKGLWWDTTLDNREGVTVKRLLEEIFDKACHVKLWWLVRLTAGLLQKRVDDSVKAVTDLLVRQKQITIGIPSIVEEAVTRPLPPDELCRIVYRVFKDDPGAAMLTLEILVYLGMFVRTEPQLFNEMIRLRIGLIIQVMTSELARAAQSTVDDAAQYLQNLSPYEMKTLLHHILSGKEFGEFRDETDLPVCKIFDIEKVLGTEQVSKKWKTLPTAAPLSHLGESIDDDSADYGQWMRRRRIDGALNRVPADFYSKIWSVLRKCDELDIEGFRLHTNLTREMTQGEIKFALTVEAVLNRIPDPEHRQLVVESLMVLTILAETESSVNLRQGVLNISGFVKRANAIFLEDQAKEQGMAVLCCAKIPPECCNAVAGICQYFYDLSPSGQFGTLNYMARAVAKELHPKEDDIECIVS